MVAGRAGERPGFPPRRLLRHRLGADQARAARSRAPARPAGSVRPRARVAAAPARVRGRRLPPALRGGAPAHRPRHLRADPDRPPRRARGAPRAGGRGAPGAAQHPDVARAPPRAHRDRSRAPRGAAAREGGRQATPRRAHQGVGGHSRARRGDGARRERHPGGTGQLRRPRSPALGPDLPPGRLARGGRRGELPPLLRREPPGRDPHGGALRVRRRPRAGLPAHRRGQGHRAARGPSRWPLRAGGVLPPAPGRRAGGHRAAPGARAGARGGGSARRPLPRPRPRPAGRGGRPTALDRGREDPEPGRAPARLVGGGRHHRLRLPGLGQRALRGPRDFQTNEQVVRAAGRRGRPPGRSHLHRQAPHHAGLDGERDQPARPSPRFHVGAQSALARLHPLQPRPRDPRAGGRVLRLPHLRGRRRARSERPRSCVHRGGGGRGQAPQSHRERLHLRLRPRRAPGAGPGPPRSRRARRPPALRDALPADDRAGHRQGRRGHRVLRLQPPRLAQRGRRRSRALRRIARRLPRQERGAPGPVARVPRRHRDPRHQARRGRARAHQRALRGARRVGRRGPALAGPRPPLQGGRGRPGGARRQRRVPVLPDPGGRLAHPGRRRADRDADRAPGRLHGEGHQGGQAPHELGEPERRLRRGDPRVRDRPARARRRLSLRLPAVPAPGRGPRRGQLARADPAQDRRPGDSRLLSGHRALGALARGSRQPPARGLRPPAGAPRRAPRPHPRRGRRPTGPERPLRRAPRALARRTREALSHAAGAHPAAAAGPPLRHRGIPRARSGRPPRRARGGAGAGGRARRGDRGGAAPDRASRRSHRTLRARRRRVGAHVGGARRRPAGRCLPRPLHRPHGGQRVARRRRGAAAPALFAHFPVALLEREGGEP